ncbi:TIGR02270 family protein [Pyxidicoccus fallax]|uniref:TIGR02270 family protein n=1 Tax=Pyxidicoccus fallax TaxID=394095 RepID=A0A848LIG7_9BACT|nr:TIGR02270 family protein [Pyxidicoccus fallax]NMO17514.1 TIGR02270 family protein [Pyxidicoccus fallax]NPC81907.1 TIGR02270 family protein [Pyxidicoccus fallax]
MENPLLSRPDRYLRWDVLETHLEEACFLWTQWEQTLSSALFTLDEVAQGDEQRLRAHLKALVAGGRRVCERLLLPCIEGDDTERLRVAAFVLLAKGEGQDLSSVLRGLSQADEAQRAAFQRALEVSEAMDLSAGLLRSLLEGDGHDTATLLEVLAFRQVPLGPRLGVFLGSSDAAVRIAALRAGRHQPPSDEEARALRGALDSSVPEEREAALALGLRRGSRTAWLACPALAAQADTAGEISRLALALGGDARDVERLIRLLEMAPLRRSVLWALGFSGRVAAADACLAHMREPGLAAVAAEAFCAITGLVLEGAFRQPPAPESSMEEERAGPLEEDPDAGLVLPNAQALEDWWANSRERFDRSARHLAGKPFSMSLLLDSLELQPMRRRPVLALELAIRSRGECEVEPRAFSDVQRQRLRRGRTLPASALFTALFDQRMTT